MKMTSRLRHLVSIVAVALAGSAAMARDQIPRGPLPHGVEPARYRIEFTVLPDRDDFSARTEISVKVIQPTRQVWLHGAGLRISEAHVVDADGKRIPAHYRQVDDLGIVQVTLDDTLRAGAAKLVFAHTAPFRTGAYDTGVVKSRYAGRTYVSTMMFPTAARTVFPGFDEPRFKTSYDISIVAPAGKAVVSNGRELRSEPLDDGRRRVTFATTRPTSTYLIGFWVGDYATVPWNAIPSGDRRKAEVAVRGIAEHGRAAAFDTPLANAPRIVGLLEEYFDTGYPYDKLDLVAIHDVGGMENAAAPSFGADVLVEPGKPLVAQRYAYYLLAHEIVHQWFGNLVTPAWWDDFWINESHATWLAHRVTARLAPGLDFERMPQRASMADMEIDSQLGSRPIEPRIETTASAGFSLNRLMYAKGNGVLAMFEHYAGQEAYRRGLRTYLKRHADGAVSSRDFLAALEEGSGLAGIGAALATFIDRPGVPLLQVDWHCADATLHLNVSQSRYAFAGSSVATAQTWQVPFCASWNEEEQRVGRCSMLREAHHELAFPVRSCPVKVMPNADGAGYYRFELPKGKFRALVDDLNHLDAAEALAVADSYGASYAAGRIGTKDYLAALPAFTAHPAWDVAVAPLSRLKPILDHVLSGAAADEAREQVRSAYAPLLRRIGLRDSCASGGTAAQPLDCSHEAGAAHEAAQLREALVPFMAMQAGDRILRDELRVVAEQLLEGPRQSTWSSGIARTALAVAAQDGGVQTFDRLTKRLAESTSSAVRLDLLTAMGAITDTSLTSKVRDLALRGALNDEEALALLSAHADVEANMASFWAWQRAHLPELLERYTGDYPRSGFIGLAGHLCTSAAGNEVRAAFAPYLKDSPEGNRALDETVDRISQCAALARRG